ncbi:MAG: AEC family transporter [Oscillospiraceae bacterium]|nr:AEC family transporter [Oscillospiraceae bacterium]
MLDTFLATVSPMMTLFICILIGYILRKTGIVPENTASVLSKLCLFVALPARILLSFVDCTLDSILSQLPLVIYGFVAVSISFVLAKPLSGLFTKEVNERKLYRYSMFSANFGYLGNAIVPAVMGEGAMAAFLIFCLPLNIGVYTWGIQSLIPVGKGEKKSVWKQLLQPPLVAMIAGLFLGLTGLGLYLPDFVTGSIASFSSCMGPLSMILTGYVIGSYDIKKLLTNVKVYWASALRLIVLPLLLTLILWLLGADKQTLLLVPFGFGSALGMNTIIIPAAYDADTNTGASMAMISHVASILTIPLLYALLSGIL